MTNVSMNLNVMYRLGTHIVTYIFLIIHNKICAKSDFLLYSKFKFEYREKLETNIFQ